MHHKPMLYVACILLAMDWWAWTSAELFTAISDLEPLLETQKKIIDDLNDYVQKEEKRLGVLKKQINAYNREHEMAMADIDNYLGNPINAFTLIKRLTTDFNFIQNRIKLGTAFVGNETSNIDVRYPTDEDLTGAAQALTRLQNTYQLDIKELAQGRLNGIVYRTPLTASDCYELGRILYNVKDYKNSLRWMEESLVKYKEENDDYNFTEVDILEYISYLFYLLDDGQKALEWTTKLFSIDPNHQRALSNIPFYLKSVAEKKARLQNNNTEVMVEEETFLQKEKKVYEALCRGEMIVPSQISRKLKCSYLTKNHPFLKLAPIKREQIYIAPDVFVYHGVMSDEEIKCIKDMAKPRFKRATVRSANGGVMSADYRISKSAWLKDEESEVVARVSQRVADFTGLTMASAELLQVVNYGIGGHYDSHYDFTLKTDLPYESADGNRIATVLFYMSEVAQGGATVFTQLGLSVFPVKSSALVWLNLHPSGEGDLSTRHAACPVLRGSKWVSNKWIHESGQEFLAPCNLEYQREEVMRKIIKAKPRAKE